MGACWNEEDVLAAPSRFWPFREKSEKLVKTCETCLQNEEKLLAHLLTTFRIGEVFDKS